jgi:hypothetical protein
MHDGENVYYITDTALAALAEELSATKPPLLTLVVRQTNAGEGLRGSVTLTDTGRAVLAGGQDRVVLCGVDRWLGGVHLRGDEAVWRWDDARQRIADR